MAKQVVTNDVPNTNAVDVMTGHADPSAGSVGLETQLPGTAATVSEVSEASGGIGAGNFVMPDLDTELFKFDSDDTPLMNLMLKAKKVKVNSPEVMHYMIDEPRYMVETNSAVAAATNKTQFVLPLPTEDQNIPRPYTTLLCEGVDGYTADGSAATPGKDLMLFVTGQDATSNNPIVRAVNGPKNSTTDEVCTVPAIPSGTKVVILSSAMYETQKELEPDVFIPEPETVYLQKRGMNQVVSDYFDSQRKQIPFTKAILAEQAIRQYKVRANRSLWAGRPSKFKVHTKLGMQLVYTSNGVRWQFKRKFNAPSKWTVEKIIGLAKMFFTGEDVPKTAILLAGKNLLESIQCIDYSKHPEVQISTKVNPVGWTVTNFHTVFGDIEIKREPTLDRLGWSNSGALIGENRLVHYQRTTEHEFSEKIEGEEATRNGIISWDALCLKGSCHIWIDGEEGGVENGVTSFVEWEDANGAAPSGSDLVSGMVYYMLQDTNLTVGQNTVVARLGTMWLYDTTNGWSEYNGVIYG